MKAVEAENEIQIYEKSLAMKNIMFWKYQSLRIINQMR